VKKDRLDCNHHRLFLAEFQLIPKGCSFSDYYPWQGRTRHCASTGDKHGLRSGERSWFDPRW